MLANGRDSFSAARTRHNWTRMRAGMAALGSFTQLLQHLQSWQRLDHSLAAYLAVLLLTQRPSLTLAAALLLLAWHVWRQRRRQHLLPEPGPAGQDEGEEVPAAGVAELKRRYDALVTFMLQVQNLLDDMAGVLERAQHALTWTDATASLLFVAGCVLLGLLVAALGAGWVFALGMVYMLRPPVLRDPLPPPPAAFFARLPAGL